MASAHFLQDDFVSTAAAAGIFTLFAVPPGYLLAWLTNLLHFRQQTVAWRLAISVPVSISAVPILAYWLDLLSGPAAVWGGFAICWIGFAVLAIWELRSGAIRIQWCFPRASIVFSLLAVSWAALAFGSLVDLPVGGDRLYTSVTSADQTYRTSFTDAISRTGIAHPVNPLGYVDGPAPLRYHYFWFILCSLVDRMGGALVPARHAFFAGTIWCGIGLACAIAAYSRFFVNRDGTLSSRWIFKGILLLAVTGLDIIPTIGLIYFGHILYMDMEAWNEAVTSWLGTLLWAPHSIAALVAGVTGFLALFHAASLENPYQRYTTAILSGALFATMLGDSIYVGFVIAVFLTLWTAITFFVKWRDHTFLLVLAGITTVVVALPYLISLTGQAGGGTFLQFTVRDFRGARAFGLPIGYSRPWETSLFRFAFLPVNYLLELGFFLIAGILYVSRLWHSRRFQLEPGQAAGLTMALTSVLICTFLKSGVITNNDLGWRGFLPAQFMLLLWAVEILRSREEKWISASRLYTTLAQTLPLLLIVGVVSTVYSIVTLRVAEILNDHTSEDAIGKRNFEARQVYEELREILPVTAIVQQNPALENPVYWGIYANRQTAVGEVTCGVEFGGTAHGCERLYPALSAIFETAQTEEVDPICSRLKIDVLVVTSGDPVWRIADSWVWKRKPLVSTGDVRAFLMSAIVRRAEVGPVE